MKLSLAVRGLFLIALVSLSHSAMAQTPVAQQRCYAQACTTSSFRPVALGDTLVAVISPSLKESLPCENSELGCGSSLFLVSDILGNQWQRAYSTELTSQVWFVTGAKPGIDIVGIMASFGYDGPDNIGPRGDFYYNVYIAEFPPSTGVDGSPSQKQSTSSPTSNINGGTVTATTSQTLLVAWTDNLGFADLKGPFSMTPTDARFVVLSDDGSLAIAAAVVDAPGPYDFTATYDGTAFWRAGLVAFRMGTPEN
jgi:hypothetical protein